MNQLNYRLSHPVAALQTSLAKDMDKYSRIRFDYASFDAQVFGKQPLMGTNQDQEMSHLSDGKFEMFSLINRANTGSQVNRLPHAQLFFFSSMNIIHKSTNSQLVVFFFLCPITQPPFPTELFTTYFSFSTSTVSWLPWCSRWPLAHLWSAQPAESIQKRRGSPSLSSDRRHP